MTHRHDGRAASAARAAIIIPARWQSTRFPGKPLARLGDTTVLGHVCRAAVQVKDAAVIVATDDPRIAADAQAHGVEAVMTSPTCRCGTERCLETCISLGVNTPVIVNLQGDEPFVSPATIESLIAALECSDADIATAIRRIEEDEEDVFNSPDAVKVVTDADGHALYFSRAPIPYHRYRAPVGVPFAYIHTGIYAFTPESLRLAATTCAASPLEQTEGLEQLAWLQSGLRIACVVTTDKTIGIDTPSDLERARALLTNRQSNGKH